MEKDNEFQLLLDEKKHKELIDVLKKILVSLDTKTNVPITDNKGVENLLNILINKNDDSIPKSITSIGNAIIKKIEDIELKQVNSIKMKEKWKFTVNRDSKGYITTVTAE